MYESMTYAALPVYILSWMAPSNGMCWFSPKCWFSPIQSQGCHDWDGRAGLVPESSPYALDVGGKKNFLHLKTVRIVVSESRYISMGIVTIANKCAGYGCWNVHHVPIIRYNSFLESGSSNMGYNSLEHASAFLLATSHNDEGSRKARALRLSRRRACHPDI